MSTAATLAARALVLALGSAAVVGQVAYLDTLSWQALGLSHTLGGNVRPALLTLLAAHAAVSAFSAWAAVTLVFRGKAGSYATHLAIAMASWSYLLTYPGIVVLLRPDPGVWRVVFQGHFLLVEALGLAGLVRFTSVFPRPLDGRDLTPIAALPVPLRPLQRIRVALLRPAAPWITAVGIALALFAFTARTGAPLGDTGLNPVMDLTRLAAAALVVLNLRRSWGLAEAESRRRLGWLVVGLTLLVSALLTLMGGNILLAVTRWPQPPVAWQPILLDCGVIGFLWGLAGTVRHPLSRDPRALSNRVVSLTSVVLVALALATGLEALLSSPLVGGSSAPNGLGTLLALLAVLSVHRPLLRFTGHMLTQERPETATHGSPEDPR